MNSQAKLSNKVNNKTALSEQLHKNIGKSQNETKSIHLTHKYMTDDFPRLVQALQ